MPVPWAFEHALLFTGHRIDAPGRVKARFPPSAEAAARAAILKTVEEVIGADASGAVGIAGGASGGDILFHEACFELGIVTRLYLALPVEAYVAASVETAGGEWVRRFRVLAGRLEVRMLDGSVELPESLTHGEALNVWARTNLWMVDEAIRLAPRRTLVALWDGRGGDGPGGTQHLVEAAPGLGLEVAPVIAPDRLVV